jgi:hypothetical protein
MDAPFHLPQEAIAPYAKTVDLRWMEEMTDLQRRELRSLLQEAYFN